MFPTGYLTAARSNTLAYSPSPSKSCLLTRGVYLSIADHNQADKGNVYVGPQGLVMVNLIHLQTENSTVSGPQTFIMGLLCNR